MLVNTGISLLLHVPINTSFTGSGTTTYVYELGKIANSTNRAQDNRSIVARFFTIKFNKNSTSVQHTPRQ